jgi:hypothetical protein
MQFRAAQDALATNTIRRSEKNSCNRFRLKQIRKKWRSQNFIFDFRSHISFSTLISFSSIIHLFLYREFSSPSGPCFHHRSTLIAISHVRIWREVV